MARAKRSEWQASDKPFPLLSPQRVQWQRSKHTHSEERLLEWHKPRTHVVDEVVQMRHAKQYRRCENGESETPSSSYQESGNTGTKNEFFTKRTHEKVPTSDEEPITRQHEGNIGPHLFEIAQRQEVLLSRRR